MDFPRASLQLDISRDNLSATLRLLPEEKPLSRELIHHALAEAGIAPARINQQAVSTLLAGSKTAVCVARGLRPVNGKPCRFLPQFLPSVSHAPVTNLQDVADYFDTHLYVAVKEGQPLMRKTRPGSGIDGVDVFGNVLSAKPGKDLKYKRGKGAAVHEQRPDLLVATKAGHPVLLDRTVQVDDSLTVKNAGLSTGDIFYDGSIFVNGNVEPGVTIEATGDLVVKGTVEKAHLKAGNNLIVGGGILSPGLIATDPEPEQAHQTTLVAGGDVQLQFMNAASVRAEANIFVARYALHSTIEAGRNLVVGEGTGKGALIAGQASARGSITVNVLGSEAYVPTLVRCGLDAAWRKAAMACEAQIARRAEELAQLNAILTRLAKETEPRKIGQVTLHPVSKIINTVASLEAVFEGLQDQKRQFAIESSLSSTPRIYVRRRLYPNVRVHLNEVARHFNKERGPCSLALQDNQLVVLPLNGEF